MGFDDLDGDIDSILMKREDSSSGTRQSMSVNDDEIRKIREKAELEKEMHLKKF